MIQLKNEHSGETHQVERIIGQYHSGKPGPHLLIFAGVHGNEPSGVWAMWQVLEKLKANPLPMCGSVTGICGNMKALEHGVRFLDEDLNRMFTPERTTELTTREPLNAEEEELQAILYLLQKYQQQEGETFFVDCHTTSSETEPYASLNSGYTASYKFARDLPLCSVVGVEKILRGCLSEHLNSLGFHGFTYEAGQHDIPATVDCQEAMIWLALKQASCLEGQSDVINKAEKTLLKYSLRTGKMLTVTDAYKIAPGEEFKMVEGFRNLDPIQRGQHLAWVNGEAVYAHEDGHILMPLYQDQGTFGYFVSKEVDTEHFAQEASEQDYLH